MDEHAKHEIERLAEFASAGAKRAAEAFGQLVGQRIEAVAPMIFESGPSSSAGDPYATGVFFELDGCLDAIVGIVFPGHASDALVRRIVGIESGELEPAIVESAIMEVGNILASHVASAIADRIGERLLPSIPSLAMADAQVELEAFIERAVGPESLRIETGFSNAGGTLGGYLVLAPTS